MRNISFFFRERKNRRKDVLCRYALQMKREEKWRDRERENKRKIIHPDNSSYQHTGDLFTLFFFLHMDTADIIIKKNYIRMSKVYLLRRRSLELLFLDI